ncbi:hypothetical protein [Streptomyces sp. NPDC088775]
MQVLGFLFQSDVSTVLTAVVVTFTGLGVAMWAASLDEAPKGRRRKR